MLMLIQIGCILALTTMHNLHIDNLFFLSLIFKLSTLFICFDACIVCIEACSNIWYHVMNTQSKIDELANVKTSSISQSIR